MVQLVLRTGSGRALGLTQPQHAAPGLQVLGRSGVHLRLLGLVSVGVKTENPAVFLVTSHNMLIIVNLTETLEEPAVPPRLHDWPSERERKLERLVFMLLNHTSHTDRRSPVRECPLCEKVTFSSFYCTD